jgi:hypothetical protein
MHEIGPDLPRRFHTTRWSLVASASTEEGEEARAALEELCAAYWYPLYAFQRRRGSDADEAADMVQGFFAALIEKGYVAQADRERGRFFSDKLKFQAGKPYPGKESRIPPRFSLLEPLPVRTTAESVLLQLEVTDDEAVKEVYAYRGDKKISYLRNRTGGDRFPIKLQVPLEVGTNRLVIIARDQKNIPAERVFFIHRTADKEEFSEVLTVPDP